MPSVAETSLAVIAGAFLIAVIVLVPALIQVRRTAARAEEALGSINESLIDLRAAVHKLDDTAGAVRDLAAALDHVVRFAETAARTVEGMRDTTRQMTRDVIMPSVASAAGLFAALWEGVQWMRPRRDKGRDGP